MAAADPSDKGQNRHSSSFPKNGKMAASAVCGRCDRPVVGVVIREMPGWYSVECKSCGHSAIVRPT